MASIQSAIILTLLAAGLWLSFRVWRGDDRFARAMVLATGLACVAWIVAGLLALPLLLHRAPWLGPLHLPALWILAMVFCTALARVSPESWLRRPLLVLPVLLGAHVALMAVGAALMGATVAGHPVWDLGRTATDPPEPQTAWWSCGAASAAALLTDSGRPTSELRAARLCGTMPWIGTPPLGAAAGLHRGGVPARIELTADYQRLQSARKPCLAYVRLFGRVLHVVTVRDADEERVLLFDPMLGETEMTAEAFREAWMWCLVVPEPGN
jgi:hypothetical protein